MSATVVSRAREMLAHTGEHPVVSVFLDLDPSEFATAPARASQVRSLLDGANGDGHQELPHEDRSALTQDLERLQEYLGSDELPVSGARTLAVFCSSRDDLFETVPLDHAVAPRVVIAPTPYIEPLVAGAEDDRLAVVLISRRSGRILTGEAQHLRQIDTIDDNVHGQHRKGGWSQANYERSADNEAEQHLRNVAHELYRSWQREPFSRLILGGPAEDVARFRDDLHNDVRPALMEERLDVDVETVGLSDVRDALVPVLDRAHDTAREAAMAELEERLGLGRRPARATRGVEDTLSSLNERRVETLLLAHNFSARGTRCPQCGSLLPEGTATCPADGQATTAVADLREAAVEVAVLQDAAVLVIGEGSDPAPPPLQRGGGIASLLRF
jgi:peptide subunit release factor 1 (eRF1)